MWGLWRFFLSNKPKLDSMINGYILRKIAPTIKPDKAEEIAELINKICPLYGINSADILHEFLANVLVESGEFRTLAENLSYSAKRLTEVWPQRFPTLEIAKQYEHNPLKLANKVYGGRMGNVNENDGFIFRGSGAIQSTGRLIITQFTHYYNNKFNADYTPEAMADLLRTDLSIAIHNAAWVFSVSKKLIQLAVDDNMNEIVKKINGGYNGLTERNNYYKKAKQFIT